MRALYVVASIVLLVGTGCGTSQSGAAPLVASTPTPSANSTASTSLVAPPSTALATAGTSAANATATTVATVAPTIAPTVAPTLAPTPAPTQAPTNGTISGKVTDAKTGAPIADFRIIVYSVSSGMCPGVESGVTLGRVVAASGADGTFTSLSQAPGTYLISANPRGSLSNQYVTWWWNNKGSCQAADQLTLTGNVTGINFAIPPSR
jgi:hypothetical protein